MSPYITVSDDSSSSGLSLDDTPSSTGYHSPRGQEPEDIAVVGMSCRVAGSSDSPEKLWEALMRKEVASGEIPPMRWEPYRRRDTRNAKVCITPSVLFARALQRSVPSYILRSLYLLLSVYCCFTKGSVILAHPFARFSMLLHSEDTSSKIWKTSTTLFSESQTKKQS